MASAINQPSSPSCARSTAYPAFSRRPRATLAANRRSSSTTSTRKPVPVFLPSPDSFYTEKMGCQCGSAADRACDTRVLFSQPARAMRFWEDMYAGRSHCSSMFAHHWIRFLIAAVLACAPTITVCVASEKPPAATASSSEHFDALIKEKKYLDRALAD